MPHTDTNLQVWKMVATPYAAAAFTGTWAFFISFIIFLGNLPAGSTPWLSPTVDHGFVLLDPLPAAAWNFTLVTAFCLQHSLMARPFVKTRLKRYVPPALERSTYVHAANLTGALVLALWQPIPLPLWTVENDASQAALWIAFAGGWLLLLWAAWSIDMLELLGLRQAWRWTRGQPPVALELKTSRLYRYLEHPMYVGVILGFWATPHMTVGHALLAVQLTLYIAVGMVFERRDLKHKFGNRYVEWRQGNAAVHARARLAMQRSSRRVRPGARNAGNCVKSNELATGGGQPRKDGKMTRKLASALSILVMMGATHALAQSPAGSPADPNSEQNRQPGPSAQTPTDPAAGASPSARVPTAPAEDSAPASEGAGAGTSGAAEAPAGSPADPNSEENRQPGPAAAKPTDPAAGSDDAAREPTAPQ